MKLTRFGWGLLALSALSTVALGQGRPPSQRSGPIAIAGPGTTGDLSATTVLPPSGGQAIRLDSLADRVVKLVGRQSTKNVFAATDGDDTNDGLSPLTPKKTLQAAVAAANPNGQVTIGAGTYTLTAGLLMQPGVRLNCLPGAKIQRGPAATFGSLIDFDTNAANGASVDRCAIDDNQSANATNVNGFTVNIGNANDVRVSGNTITGSLGYSVYVRDGLRPVVTGNTLNGSFVAAVSIIPTMPSRPVNGTITDNLMNGPFGLHAMIVNQADNTVISRNKILSPQPRLATVSTSGNTVTTSGGGNDFTNTVPGQFITMNGGFEYLITAKASNTSLTINASPAAMTNVPAVMGDGDLISAANMQHGIISDNYVYGGGAGGIVVSNFIASANNKEDYGFNTISNNQVTFSAAACISIQATTTTPATFVYDNLITGNLVHRCGIGAASQEATNRTGISVYDFTGTQGMSRTTIVGNLIRDDFGNHQYGISLSGIAAGQVFAGNNSISGAANPGIRSGIKSITLSPGWGSTAFTSGVQTSGSSFSFTITSSGTGQAAQPTATVVTSATTVDQPPVQSCKMVAGTGTFANLFGEQNADATQQIVAYNGTPVAGATYTINCR